MPSPVTVINGIEIDVRSEAMHDTACADCATPILVDPSVRDIPEDQRHLERVAVCAPCGRTRLTAVAAEQRQVEIVKKASAGGCVACNCDSYAAGGQDSFGWKVCDCQHTQIAHTRTTTTNKENHMIDLNNLSDAELGAIVRQRMLTQAAESLPAKRDEAVRVEMALTTQVEAEIKAKQERRVAANPLAEFAVGTTLTVPALDLSAVDGLDEAVSAKTRSPYNKARFRLEGSAPLDPETTTYVALAAEHVRLSALAAEKATVKQVEQVKPESVQVVAVLDDGEAAKVAALMETIPLLDEAGARALLATL